MGMFTNDVVVLKTTGVVSEGSGFKASIFVAEEQPNKKESISK